MLVKKYDVFLNMEPCWSSFFFFLAGWCEAAAEERPLPFMADYWEAWVKRKPVESVKCRPLDRLRNKIFYWNGNPIMDL